MGCDHEKVLLRIPEFVFKKGGSNLVSPILCPGCNLYLVRKKTKIVLEGE